MVAGASCGERCRLLGDCRRFHRRSVGKKVAPKQNIEVKPQTKAPKSDIATSAGDQSQHDVVDLADERPLSLLE
jgi:hypothetical protein